MKQSNIGSEYLGRKYERLAIIGFERAKPPMRGWMWRVECECGNVKVVYPGDVKSGKIKSCGCLHSEVSRTRATKFKNGVADNARLYGIYNHMKRRCLKPSCKRYKDYGARGISVCREWLDSFDTFVNWANANGYADNLTLERKDVNGNYCPENCAWITRRDQAKNKRDTVWVEYNGEKVRLMDLAKTSAVQYDTLHDRVVVRGWDVESAVMTPSAKVKKTFKQICAEKGLKDDTVRARMHRYGWSLEKALNTPVKSKRTDAVL